MSVTGLQIRQGFGRTFKGVDDAHVYDQISEAHKLIVRHFGTAKQTVVRPVVYGEGVIDLDVEIVWIETCRYLNTVNATVGVLGGSKLDETSTDEEDVEQGDWRANPPGVPSKFMQTHSLAMGQMQFDRPPNKSTLIVVSATAATPIVATLSDEHQMTDGQRFDVYNGAGMVAINGGFYAKATGYAANQVALYSDVDLTIPVAGAGVYTASSALVVNAISPAVQIFSRWCEPVVEATVLPDTPFYKNLYIHGACWFYASLNGFDDQIAKYDALFNKIIGEQAMLTMKRTGRKNPRINVIEQRSDGYTQDSFFGPSSGRRR